MIAPPWRAASVRAAGEWVQGSLTTAMTQRRLWRSTKLVRPGPAHARWTQRGLRSAPAAALGQLELMRMSRSDDHPLMLKAMSGCSYHSYAPLIFTAFSATLRASSTALPGIRFCIP